MISLTRLNHTPVVLNCDLIEFIETSPDTVIRLTNGQRIMVLENPGDVISRVVEFRRRIRAAVPLTTQESDSNGGE